MTNLPFDEVIDRCIDNISAGRRTVAECVDAYPEHRAELEPLLEAAFAVHALPRIPERTPDPRRRAALMAQIRATPQQSRSRVARPRLGDVLGLSGLRLSMARLATTFVPAAAVAGAAVFAILLVLGRGTSTASASTLTVFAGTVEVESGGTWTAAADGAALAEGTRLRTTADGRAMLTFVDGSTATLEPDTEIVLERVRVNGVRQITIDQRTGRLWNDVVPNGRRGAAYAVRAPDAVAQALGTVFETTVENGTTVTTADGLVQVRAGDRSVRVPAGELVRARAQRIAERLGVTPEAELTVDAPFVASLIARDGQATGARPDGVVFRQLAGVTTTDPARGPQQINLLRAEPGEYTLLLRRFAEGEGAVVIRTATGDVRIPVEAGGRDQQVVLRVRLVDGAPQFEVVNRAELAAQLRAEQERIIESKRTQQAIAVAKARAEAEQARREAEREKRDAEQAERARRKAEARRGKAEAEGRPTAPGARPRDQEPPRATPEGRAPGTGAVPSMNLDAPRRALMEALARNDREALRRVLGFLLTDDSALGRAERARLLAEVAQEGAAGQRLREFFAQEEPALGRRLLESLGDDAPRELRERLRELLTPGRDRPLLPVWPRNADPQPRPTATPRPGDPLPRPPVATPRPDGQLPRPPVATPRPDGQLPRPPVATPRPDGQLPRILPTPAKTPEGTRDRPVLKPTPAPTPTPTPAPRLRPDATPSPWPVFESPPRLPLPPILGTPARKPEPAAAPTPSPSTDSR